MHSIKLVSLLLVAVTALVGAQDADNDLSRKPFLDGYRLGMLQGEIGIFVKNNIEKNTNLDSFFLESFYEIPEVINAARRDQLGVGLVGIFWPNTKVVIKNYLLAKNKGLRDGDVVKTKNIKLLNFILDDDKLKD